MRIPHEEVGLAGGRSLHGVMVGAGHFAAYHADAWHRVPGVRITAVCDIDRHAADDLAQRHGIGARFADWREMIDSQRPDFVDVVTPPDTHDAICRHAAARGVHVICQKPLTSSLEEATALVDDVARARVRFMVHANWRWQPWYRRTRELLDDGAIGAPFSLSFLMRTGESWDVDAFLDRPDVAHEAPRMLLREMGVHFVDSFRYLLGEVETVYARTRRHNRIVRGEDAALVVLGFVDGPTAILDASRYNESTAADPMFTFGTMRLDGAKGHLLLHADGNLSLHPLGGIPELVEVDIPEAGFAGDCVRATQGHFAEALRTGVEFETPGRDWLRTLRVVEAAYRSAESGEVVAPD